MIDIDLDPTPVASVRIRYEFHPQLVKLGILPQYISLLERREHASGFRLVLSGAISNDLMGRPVEVEPGRPPQQTPVEPE